MNTNDNKIHNYTLASKTQRLLGFICDLLVQFIIIYAIQLIFFKMSIDEFLNSEIDYYSVGINSIIAFVFGAITYPFFGGNIGHKIIGLKVIDIKSGKDFKSPFQGGGREFLKNLLSYMVIPIIWIFFDKRNQNLYDKLTNTCVVKK